MNFEFTPLSDEHFEAACDVLPKGLAKLNLNGCREISERTIMIIAKQCQRLNRLGMLKKIADDYRVVLELQDH